MDLILSDLHANLHALRVVLRYVRRKPIRRFVILGDLVGYGAYPNQVLERVQALRPCVILRGNHDRACAHLDEGHHFSLPAQIACLWTRSRLSPRNARWLRSLPKGSRSLGPELLAAHGAPHDEDAYLLQERDAAWAFTRFQERLCFFGHTHHAGGWEWEPATGRVQGLQVEPGRWVDLDPNRRYLINPGSVGQPRDRDPRASFLTYDPDRHRVKWHRMDYDIEAAARAILDADLHVSLAERLYLGT